MGSKFELTWKDPNRKDILICKYIQPWAWEDTIGLFELMSPMFASVEHEVSLIHDQSTFPQTQTAIGAIRDIWGKAPKPPKNLKICIIVAPQRFNMLETAFDVVEKLFFNKKITYFVDNMDNAKELLAKRGVKAD